MDAVFKLPRIVPDFSMMARDDLEDYAANLDHLYRGLEHKTQSFADDLVDFSRVVAHQNTSPTKINHLTKYESRLVACLKEDALSKEKILNTIYANRIALDDVPNIKIIDVFVTNARSLMAALGCPIETVWGNGYKISKIKKLRRLVNHFKDCGSVPILDFTLTNGAQKAEYLTDAQKSKIVALAQNNVPPIIIAERLHLQSRPVRAVLSHARREGVHIPKFTNADVHSYRGRQAATAKQVRK